MERTRPRLPASWPVCRARTPSRAWKTPWSSGRLQNRCRPCWPCGNDLAPRQELRQVFVRLKDERGAGVVAQQLADRDERTQALAALKQMGSEAARPTLAGYANHPDAGVRDGVRQQLKDWG